MRVPRLLCGLRLRRFFGLGLGSTPTVALVPGCSLAPLFVFPLQWRRATSRRRRASSSVRGRVARSAPVPPAAMSKGAILRARRSRAKAWRRWAMTRQARATIRTFRAIPAIFMGTSRFSDLQPTHHPALGVPSLHRVAVKRERHRTRTRRGGRIFPSRSGPPNRLSAGRRPISVASGIDVLPSSWRSVSPLSPTASSTCILMGAPHSARVDVREWEARHQ